MRIVQVNVRLTEGGAARVALDLHRRLLANGEESRFHYGYSRRGGSNPFASEIPASYRLAAWPGVMTNYALHELAGIEAVPPQGAGAAALIRDVAAADAVHLHVTHSYFLPIGWLAKLLREHARRVIWTAHDSWLLTGRCAILEGCEAWHAGCGKCPTGRNYPRARVDLSEGRRRRRIDAVRSLGDRLTLVSPSSFLGDRLRSVYPDLDIAGIPNGTDLEFERCLSAPASPPPVPLRTRSRLPRVLIVANDLSHKAKADPDVITAMRSRAAFELVTVGSSSPFKGDGVINLGTVTSRAELVAIYRACDALLFTSTVDNSPLVLIEALSAGLPVLAVQADAQWEILERIDARPVSGPEEAVNELARPDCMGIYGGRSRASVAAHSQEAFGGQRMMRLYSELYNGGPRSCRTAA